MTIILLRAICIAFFLTPWLLLVTTAAPIPVNEHTQYASSHHPDHGRHVQASQAHPGPVHIHNTPIAGTTNHLAGSVLVAPQHVNGMSRSDLHAHAQRAKEVLDQRHPSRDYHVQAHHTPGDAHVMIHAVPSADIAHRATPRPAESAVRHAGPTHENAPHKNLSPENRKKVADALDAAVHPHDHNQPPHPLHTTQHHPGQHGVHGPVTTGTIPVAHPSLAGTNGMQASALHMHAEWINSRLVPPEQKGKVHVHVTTAPGTPHVNYHTVPARDHVSHDEIKTFLNSRGNSHYEGQSLTRARRPQPGQNGLTFHGTIPAHTKQQMTPDQLHVYAKHAQDQLIAHHRLTGDDANGMVVAAVHKEGDDKVHFHTQPKTNEFMKALSQGTRAPYNKYPQINQAHDAVGHTKVLNDNTLVRDQHAEPAALARALHAKDATAASFNEDVQGHVIGVAGARAWKAQAEQEGRRYEGDRPCRDCHRMLNQLPGVTYADMNRPLN